MIVVNFSHALTTDQLARIEELTGAAVERVIDVPTQFDHDIPFAEQIPGLVAAAGLTKREWEGVPSGSAPLVNLPAYAPIAAMLLAYLHGLSGHFPAVLRLRPRHDAAVPTFEVAEVVNLQALRDAARQRGGG